METGVQNNHIRAPMLTLDQLNDEILVDILSLVHKSSKHTLFSLIQVNKVLHDCTLPFIYRECTFDFTQNVPSREKHEDMSVVPPLTPFVSTVKNIDRLLQMDSSMPLFRSVRKIVLRSTNVIWAGDQSHHYWAFGDPPYIPSEEEVHDKWSSFIKFLSRVAHLHELVFDCQERVPLILLETLHNHHPSSHLHVRNWTRNRTDTRVGDPYEEALACSPCLRSIHTLDTLTDGGRLMELTEAAFQRILSLSPNLESFTYTTRQLPGGCVKYGLGRELQHARSKFLIGEDKSVQKDMKTIRWKSLGHSMIERWRAFINFRTVQTLDLGSVGNPAVLEYIRAQGMFEGVRHLSFEIVAKSFQRSIGNQKGFLINFLSSFQHLESLSIVNYSGWIDLMSLLVSHGESLRSLSLHQRVDYGMRPVLTLEKLQLVSSSAPYLENLEIDINFTDENEHESKAYEILASFAHLQTLTIYYDIKIVDAEFGKSVWCAVESPGRRARTHGKLKELNLFIEEPHGSMWLSDEYKKPFIQEVYMTPCERDDMMDRIDVRIV